MRRSDPNKILRGQRGFPIVFWHFFQNFEADHQWFRGRFTSESNRRNRANFLPRALYGDCVTLLTTLHGREVHTHLAEIVPGPKTGGQQRHFQALVFVGGTHSGERGRTHVPSSEQHLPVLDRK